MTGKEDRSRHRPAITLHWFTIAETRQYLDGAEPETVVVVFGQVGSLKQRVVIAGGQGGWPQKH
jgi:hypothetical protein